MSEKNYNDLSTWLKEHYGEKLYKLSLDGGFTCPNRDGTLGNGGCIFCSTHGSGDFSSKVTPASMEDSLKKAILSISKKVNCKRYIAYFQAYTNTYGDPKYLKELYSSALLEKDIAGISIATRPDCLPEPVLQVLGELKKEFPDKFIWIELGLQTIHDQTAAYINRGYSYSIFPAIVRQLHSLGFLVIVHIILGLPGENDQMVLATIDALNHLPIWGIKLQLLHVIKGTRLCDIYEKGDYIPLSFEHYLKLLISCIEALRPDVVIHRVTGDPPSKDLIAPLYSLQKRKVLNTLHKQMREQDSFQAKSYHPE